MIINVIFVIIAILSLFCAASADKPEKKEYGFQMAAICVASILALAAVIIWT